MGTPEGECTMALVRTLVGRTATQMALLQMTLSFGLVFSHSAFAQETPPTPLQSVVPKIQLSFWNDDSQTLYNNNCYNYSTNRATNSFAQPGEASDKIYSSLTCESVLEAAKADLGLQATDEFPFGSKNDDTLIALVVAPEWDYHWYRRDDDGLWSHKPGGTPATNMDSSGEIITSPETANRGPYTEFCDYFRVKDYPKDDHQQNGGYVRIGNMQALPSLGQTFLARPQIAKSTLRSLQFSGRRNPTVSLQKILAIEANLEQLKTLKASLEQAPTATLMESLIISKLGQHSLLIDDAQGVFFAKGTRLQIDGLNVLAHVPNETQARRFHLNQPLQLNSGN